MYIDTKGILDLYRANLLDVIAKWRPIAT